MIVQFVVFGCGQGLCGEEEQRRCGPFTVQTPRWFVGRSSEARRSVHVPSASAVRAAHCASGSHVHDGADYQEVKNSWSTDDHHEGAPQWWLSCCQRRWLELSRWHKCAKPPLEPERFGARGSVGGSHPFCRLVVLVSCLQLCPVSLLSSASVLTSATTDPTRVFDSRLCRTEKGDATTPVY